MRAKVTVVGAEDLAQRLTERDYAHVTQDIGELSGSTIVVLATARDDEELLGTIRDRAPNAIVLVCGASPQRACEVTLFPRSRIIGVNEKTVLDVVDTILLDRQRTIVCTVRLEGEHGREGEYAEVPVRIGAKGVEEIPA
jgi:hypothetical protein